MIKRLFILTAACFALFVATASAQPPVQTITVVNEAGFSQTRLNQFERVLVIQSQQLRRKWDTPLVQFGPGGWQMTLIPGQSPILTNVGPGVLGWHDAVSDQGGTNDPYPPGVSMPYAYVGVDTPGIQASVVMSHELMEMLVDPNITTYVNGRLAEVCDPLEDGPNGWIDGVQVAHFVTPNYFYRP